VPHPFSRTTAQRSRNAHIHRVSIALCLDDVLPTVDWVRVEENSSDSSASALWVIFTSVPRSEISSRIIHESVLRVLRVHRSKAGVGPEGIASKTMTDFLITSLALNLWLTGRPCWGASHPERDFR
jgi:hypothetical protein